MTAARAASLEVEPIPLESGDRLTRAEFHRRYCARPDITRAELIDGVVYVSSPVSARHGEPHGSTCLWVGTYTALIPGLRMFDNSTVFLDPDTEVQPDVLLVRDPPRPGGAVLTPEHYIEGSPDFVAEVAASSASYDLHSKLQAYQRAGVPEYLVWQVYERRIDWFRLRDGVYAPLLPDTRGVIASVEFPGLRLDVAAMLAGDNAAVLKAVRRPRARRSPVER